MRTLVNIIGNKSQQDAIEQSVKQKKPEGIAVKQRFLRNCKGKLFFTKKTRMCLSLHQVSDPADVPYR